MTNSELTSLITKLIKYEREYGKEWKKSYNLLWVITDISDRLHNNIDYELKALENKVWSEDND